MCQRVVRFSQETRSGSCGPTMPVPGLGASVVSHPSFRRLSFGRRTNNSMRRRLRADDLYRITTPQEPTLAPGGPTVVYGLGAADRKTDRTAYSLWQVATDGSPPRRLTEGPADTAPAYSPDGSRIAFLRARGAQPPQLWLLPAGSG